MELSTAEGRRSLLCCAPALRAYLLPGPPLSLHFPLEALGPLLRIISLLLQNLDLALYRLDGGVPGHGAYPAASGNQVPTSSARRCSRFPPYFRLLRPEIPELTHRPDVTPSPPRVLPLPSRRERSPLEGSRQKVKGEASQ